MRGLLKRVTKNIIRALGYDIHRKGMRVSLAGLLDHVSTLGFPPETIIDRE